MRKIISSKYFYILSSVVILAVVFIIQPTNTQIDFISKAGTLISMLASIFLFHRLLGKGIAEASCDENDNDCGEYDGTSLEEHIKEGRNIVLNDYWGIILIIFGTLVSVLGDLIKNILWPN